MKWTIFLFFLLLQENIASIQYPPFEDVINDIGIRVFIVALLKKTQQYKTLLEGLHNQPDDEALLKHIILRLDEDILRAMAKHPQPYSVEIKLRLLKLQNKDPELCEMIYENTTRKLIFDFKSDIHSFVGHAFDLSDQKVDVQFRTLDTIEYNLIYNLEREINDCRFFRCRIMKMYVKLMKAVQELEKSFDTYAMSLFEDYYEYLGYLFQNPYSPRLWKIIYPIRACLERIDNEIL